MGFSFNRFLLFIKADVTENKAIYLSTLVGSFAAMVLMAVFFSQFSTVPEEIIHIKSTFNVFTLFIVVLTICLAFWDIPSKGKYINLVQKPASMLEKYVARLLFFVFIFPMAQRLFFLVVEFCRVLFCPRFEGDWFMSIYGRGDGESFWDYYMGVDQAIGTSLLFGWATIALVIYFSSTFGGIKSFLRVVSSFLFGLVVFVIFIILKKEYDFAMNVEVDGGVMEVADIYKGIIMSSGIVYAASSFAMMSFASRNVNINPRFRSIFGFAAMIIFMAMELFVYNYMVELVVSRNVSCAIVCNCVVCSVNLVWLMYGSYRNFANRQLSYCLS